MKWILIILAVIIVIIVCKIRNDSKKYEKLLNEQKKESDDLRSQNLKLQKDLEFFTKIGSDSKQLNDTGSYKELIHTDPDEEQSYIFDLMTNGNDNLFITGKAGTGKSFLLKLFVDLSGKNVLVTAPTGIAALNAGGVTIHSVFGYKNLVNTNIDDLDEETLQLKSDSIRVLQNLETILIDEISMVRSDVFQKIDKIMRIVNDCDLPFGGKQIILFGDLYQLPPIVNRNEIEYLKDKFNGKYFFNAKAYKDGGFKLLELTVNHRQEKDPFFFDMLSDIREGKLSEEKLLRLNERNEFDPGELRRVIRILPFKKQVDLINRSELGKITAPEYEFKSEVKIHKPDMTFDIEKNMPISETLKLKLGALVMMTTNDEDHRWVNGTLGIVSGISESRIFVSINDREYEISKATFEQQEAKYENGKIEYETVFEVKQYPVVLAYAMTIHKSQGMTYRKIACDVSECFESGQAYVALSRCTALDGLYLLRKLNFDTLKVDNEIVEFYKAERSSY